MSDVVIHCSRERYLGYLQAGRRAPGARFTLSRRANLCPAVEPLDRLYLACDGQVRGFLIVHTASVDDVSGDATMRPVLSLQAYLSTWRWITPIPCSASSAIRSAERLGITRLSARVIGDFTTPPIQIPPPRRGQ